MTSHTVYRTFNTSRRREFVRITEDGADAVRESGIVMVRQEDADSARKILRQH